MVGSQPIVVGFDGSAGAREALHWSLAAARYTHLPVELDCAFEWHVFAEPVAAIAPVRPECLARRQARAMLDTALAEAARGYPDVPLAGVMIDGRAVSVLVARSRRARLLVLGCRGHGGFTGLWLGSTALMVAAEAHCPVVVVRGEARPPERPGHVLAGVDGSAPSRVALAFAFEQAAARGADLRVVRVFSPSAPNWKIPELGVKEAPASRQAAYVDLVAKWRERYPTVPVTAAAVTGSATSVLLDATGDAQLAVIGARGGDVRPRPPLGVVSHHLLHHARCPVVLVREASASPVVGQAVEPARLSAFAV